MFIGTPDAVTQQSRETEHSAAVTDIISIVFHDTPDGSDPFSL
jgi:hypothetical protein